MSEPSKRLTEEEREALRTEVGAVIERLADVLHPQWRGYDDDTALSVASAVDALSGRIVKHTEEAMALRHNLWYLDAMLNREA